MTFWHQCHLGGVLSLGDVSTFSLFFVIVFFSLYWLWVHCIVSLQDPVLSVSVLGKSQIVCWHEFASCNTEKDQMTHNIIPIQQ